MTHSTARRRWLWISLVAGSALFAAAGFRAAGAHEGRIVNLKELENDHIVRSISYCRGTYTITTAAGKNHVMTEFNLRFKTDSGINGPHPGKPVFIRAGMQGDRAFVVFSGPDEFQKRVVARCKEERS